MRAGSDKSVTAAQVNGTWQTKWGEFKIWALGHQHLQVEFSGVYEYKTPRGPSANTGEGSGIATIEGDTATFKPEGAEGMPDHAKIHWRQTCSHSNRHLWIRSQRDRCRHLQKNFRKETKVRVGLTSALEFLLWNSVAAQHSRRRCPGGFAVYVAHPIRSIPAFLKDSEFEIGP